MSGGDDWSGRKVTTSRARWSARLPLPCWLGCGGVVDGTTPWVVEHDPPRWMQRRAGVTRITTDTEAGVSHRSCSDRSGGRTAAAITNARRGSSSSSRRARRLEDRPLRW